MRDLTYPLIAAGAEAAVRVLGWRVDIDGAARVPRLGGAVLAVNHVSYVDFIFAGLAIRPSGRRVRFLSKRELFAHRLTGPLMRSLHHLEVDRADGRGGYDAALRCLADGELVGVFPEATISRSFELKSFKTGAVRLAAAAGVPLVPAVLWGTQRIYTKDHPHDFSRGQQIAISIGEPWWPAGADPVTETIELRERMRVLLDATIRRGNVPAGAWWLPRSYGGSAPTRREADRLDAVERRARARST